MLRWYRAQARNAGDGDGRGGAVTFISRGFSSSLLLYPHLHVVVLDGVYTRPNAEQPPSLIAAAPPTEADMCEVAEEVAHRMAALLQRFGFVDAASERNESTALDRWYADLHREPAELAAIDGARDVVIGAPTAAGAFDGRSARLFGPRPYPGVPRRQSRP